jgi:uncharacterized protein (TIGR03089 family)
MAWAASLRRDPGRPFLTFYDDASGERVELSFASTDNWVSKTANLLVEELDCQPGDVLAIALPPHWQSVVFQLAGWAVGMTVMPGVVRDAAVQVVGPDYAPGGWDAEVEVVACSLRPLGGRFATPLEAGLLDYAVVVPGQSDHFTAIDPPTGDTLAVGLGDLELTHAELLGRQWAAARGSLDDAERVLTDHDLTTEPGVRLLADVLVTGSTIVLVRNLDPDTLDAKRSQERVDTLRLASVEPPAQPSK